MTGRKRVRLIAAVMLICAALLLSFVFVAVFAEHHCDHDGCAVCRVIDMCVHTARLCFGEAPAALLMTFAAVTALTAVIAASARSSTDPVSLKVRLRN